MNRRNLIALLALALALACAFAPAARAAWPENPVKIIVALPPGSGADTTARFIARHLAQALGQPFETSAVLRRWLSRLP
jgi:tripartite-type tricarboxylate transporter receptor subunit TctC